MVVFPNVSFCFFGFIFFSFFFNFLFCLTFLLIPFYFFPLSGRAPSQLALLQRKKRKKGTGKKAFYLQLNQTKTQIAIPLPGLFF
jgi:hypothetical protein